MLWAAMLFFFSFPINHPVSDDWLLLVIYGEPEEPSLSKICDNFALKGWV